jgi:hypothetical protein
VVHLQALASWWCPLLVSAAAAAAAAAWSPWCDDEKETSVSFAFNGWPEQKHCCCRRKGKLLAGWLYCWVVTGLSYLI